MAAKLSWNPAPATARGLMSKSASPAAESDVAGSFSRRKRGAESSMHCMIPARVTEGVKPTIAMKQNTSGMPRIAVRRLEPETSPRAVMRKPTCMPETATTWEKPAVFMAVETASSA